MQLIAATNNVGKLRELRALLDPLVPVSPAELDLDLEVEESGRTFAENAVLKAQAFARETDLIAVADDSGLEVDVLDGAPGVLSARFGDPGLDDAGRCRLLLERLSEVPAERRQARFRCCIVAAGPDGRTCRAEGICEGLIAREAAGDAGFGYDPIFYLPQYERTMAQVSPDLKNQISHRATALTALRGLLFETFPELLNRPS